MRSFGHSRTAPPGIGLPGALLSRWGHRKEPTGSKEEAELDFQRQWARFDWDHILRKLRQYWETYRYYDRIAALISPEGKRVLDVGCGVVSVLNIIPAAGSRVGIDPLMQRYLELYRLDPGIKWLAGGAEVLPVADRSFDIVFCTNVLDHVGSPAKALSEVDRVLAPQGHFVFSVDVFPKREQRDKAHPHAFTLDRLHGLLDANFKVLFEKASPSRAQVYNFVNETMQQTDEREVVAVAVAKA